MGVEFRAAFLDFSLAWTVFAVKTKLRFGEASGSCKAADSAVSALEFAFSGHTFPGDPGEFRVHAEGWEAGSMKQLKPACIA